MLPLRAMAQEDSQALDALLVTMARLRGPEGCPWDQEQTHDSLTENLIEECAELLEAIDERDPAHLCEELGDVLLQVVFHAQLAAETGAFDFHDVARRLNEKLVRRHPHVFGDAQVTDTAGLHRQWEAIKAEEAKAAGRTPDAGPWKALPPRLPALLFARAVAKQRAKAQQQAVSLAAHDASPPSQPAADLADEAEAGRALYALVEACQRAGIDPEGALRRHAAALHRAWLQASRPRKG